MAQGRVPFARWINEKSFAKRWLKNKSSDKQSTTNFVFRDKWVISKYIKQSVRSEDIGVKTLEASFTISFLHSQIRFEQWAFMQLLYDSRYAGDLNICSWNFFFPSFAVKTIHSWILSERVMLSVWWQRQWWRRATEALLPRCRTSRSYRHKWKVKEGITRSCTRNKNSVGLTFYPR